MKKIITLLVLLYSIVIHAQIDNARVYWVGHSLISHTDNYSPSTFNLPALLSRLVNSQGKSYSYYQHTVPGAPLGWNWGATPAAWNDIKALIQPLIDTSHVDYGTFDVMVLTEGIELSSTHFWWNSSFYARKFYNAARRANPNTRLFMYESWHHFHAMDDVFRSQYGPISKFDWDQYMGLMRVEWEKIVDETSLASRTQTDSAYSYQGPGIDPGLGDDTLSICLIPTGSVLRKVLDRLNQNLPNDDWSYNGSTLNELDFFANPLANFPDDTVTPIYPSDPVDDIHPSNVLIYLNSLVHYAVIYQEDPSNLPADNGVPDNIADIFKEVVWDVVSNDPRTCVSGFTGIDKINSSNLTVYPNPSSGIIRLNYLDSQETIYIFDILGKIAYEFNGKNNTIDISEFADGIYFIKVGENPPKKIIKY